MDICADLAERAMKTESFCSFLRLTFQLHNRYRSQIWNMNEDKRCVWRAATGWERGHRRQWVAPLNPTVAAPTAFPNSAAFPSCPAADSGGVISPRWNCTDKLLIKVFPQSPPARALGVHSTFCAALANWPKVKKEVFYFPNPSQTAIGHYVIQSV